MNGLDLLKDINELDETMIREAAPKEKSGRGTMLRLGGIAAAVILLAVGVGVWMQHPGRVKGPAKERASEQTEAVKPQETERQMQQTTETAGPQETEPILPSETTAPFLQEGDPDILYQDSLVTVRRIMERVAGSIHTEYCLAYLTERELFEKCTVLLRGKVTGITNLSIERSGWDQPTEACVLTVEPTEILRGSLITEGPVKIFIDRYINSSLEDLNLSLRTADVGREGILLLYKPFSSSYQSALADYSVGDNQRFAIWESSTGGLLYDKNAFTGLSADWDLDQAEAYIRSVLDDAEPIPEDFAVSLEYQNWGENGSYNTYYRFDSRDGSYSRAGDTWWEKTYGAENTTANFEVDEDLRRDLFRSCRGLLDLPDEFSQGKASGERETWVIEINVRMNGKEKHLFCAGSSEDAEYTEYARRILTAEQEISHYIEQYSSRLAWEKTLVKIAEQRRREQSATIEETLQAAFDQKYGPGGRPDYFLGTKIVDGGLLQIRLKATEDKAQLGQWVGEICELLKDVDGDYLFAIGEEPET